MKLIQKYFLLHLILCTVFYTHAGWSWSDWTTINHDVSPAKVQEIKAAVKEIVQDSKDGLKEALSENFSDEKLKELQNTITTALNNSVDYMANKTRLLPIYASGTVLLGLSANMGWQALNDYLNHTDQTAHEKEKLHSKLKRKLITMAIFGVLGSSTFYFSDKLGATFCGYQP